MDTGLLIVIMLLMLMLCGFVLLYFFTQQSLRQISNRLEAIQPARASTKRSPETIRRERAFCHDKLVVLEASLSVTPREDLTAEELEEIDRARRIIKGCIDELKACGDWLGLPFDFEWAEMLERLPNVNALYRKAAALAAAAAETAASAKSN